MLPVLVWRLVFLCKKMFISLSTVHDMPDKYVAIHQLAAVLHEHIIISNIAVVEASFSRQLKLLVTTLNKSSMAYKVHALAD